MEATHSEIGICRSLGRPVAVAGAGTAARSTTKELHPLQAASSRATMPWVEQEVQGVWVAEVLLTVRPNPEAAVEWEETPVALQCSTVAPLTWLTALLSKVARSEEAVVEVPLDPHHVGW
jgi:hypothetical protein